MKKIILLFTFLSFIISSQSQTCDDTLPITENFDDSSVIGICWNLMDQDGDGYNWYWKEYSSIYGGYKCLTSKSYSTSVGVLNPDNWIISYPIDLTSYSSSDNIEVSYKVRGELVGFAHENYTIYAATGNQISDFESSSVKRTEFVDEVGGEGNFVTRYLDLSSLAGSMVYLAFRHHESSNQWVVNIDDIFVSTSLLGLEDQQIDSFKHYYNKDTDKLNITSSNNNLSKIQLYSIIGQQVLTKNLSTSEEIINLSFLKDGIYIGKVRIDKHIQSFKFIKQ